MAVPGDEKKSGNSSDNIFTSATPILGLKLYVIIAATTVITIAIFVVIFVIFRLKWNSKRRRSSVKHNADVLPTVSNEIAEGKQSDPVEIYKNVKKEQKQILRESMVPKRTEGIKQSMESNESSMSLSETSSVISASTSMVEGMNIGWGRWYSLKELEMATDGFSEENVIGEGGYGVVYRGVLQDSSVIAIKSLLNNKGQAEKEFQVELEAIGKVRHKNLVGLIGYCAEGARRLLVYEYVDNGNLEQWLHGDVGTISPLTWDIRMKIATGTARGLAHLHEGLEPKVVHRDIKSSNILLDRKWNPKVSDFGLAKLLGSEKSHLTTRVMGTFGYVSPDYASTGMLNEASDVYSFGILLMEIVTGRTPVDYSRPPGEMNLVDWFKGLVASRRGEELLDPFIIDCPPSRALKRVLLVCLRCIDLDPSKRPKMGQIVHMLEAEEFPFRREPRPNQETASLNSEASESYRSPLASRSVVGGDEPSSRWR